MWCYEALLKQVKSEFNFIPVTWREVIYSELKKLFLLLYKIGHAFFIVSDFIGFQPTILKLDWIANFDMLVCMIWLKFALSTKFLQTDICKMINISYHIRVHRKWFVGYGHNSLKLKLDSKSQHGHIYWSKFVQLMSLHFAYHKIFQSTPFYSMSLFNTHSLREKYLYHLPLYQMAHRIASQISYSTVVGQRPLTSAVFCILVLILPLCWSF